MHTVVRAATAILSVCRSNVGIRYCVKMNSRNAIFTAECIYYVLQSQKIATGYANNKIDKEAVKIDINTYHGYTIQ